MKVLKKHEDRNVIFRHPKEKGATTKGCKWKKRGQQRGRRQKDKKPASA